MKQLETLAKKPFFTTEQAKKQRVSPRMLSYYVKQGKLTRIARGVYCAPEHETNSTDLQWEDLAIAATNIPGAVICLVSALSYYKLTDHFMKKFWIAVDNASSKARFPKTQIVRMRNMDLGVQTITLAGMKVKIFDIERTIVDSFRLLDFETAMKSLKQYLSGATGRPNMKKLDEYTRKLRASKLREYIMAIAA